MKTFLLLSLFAMSVTPSQFPTINQASLDGSETLWAQKGGVDYKLLLDDFKQYGGCDDYCTSLVIPSAQVLTLNGTPLTMVAAPGAGKAIEVISASAKIVYGTVPYDTGVILQLINNGATISQCEWIGNALLASTVSRITKALMVGVVINTSTQILENTALMVNVKTSNPATGDSPITVYVKYRIITL